MFNFDKTPTFSRVFHPKMNRQFSREIKVEFLDKKWRFRTVCWDILGEIQTLWYAVNKYKNKVNFFFKSHLLYRKIWLSSWRENLQLRNCFFLRTQFIHTYSIWINGLLKNAEMIDTSSIVLLWKKIKWRFLLSHLGFGW